MAGLALAAAGIGAYFIMRYLKGSITISLPNTAYNSGGQVEGSFELLTRQDIKGNNLTAALVATEVTEQRGHNGRRTSRSRELCRVGQTLEHARDYPAGYRADYNFKLAVPALQRQGGGDSLLGQALDMLSSTRSRVDWTVEVRLDAEGVDLASSQSIAVND